MDRGSNRRDPVTLLSVAAAAALCAWAPAPMAAQNPNVLLDAFGEVRDEAFDYMRMPLTGEDRVYERIDGRHIKELMNEVVGFSRRSRDDGNKYWGRMSGTEYERMTADWLERRFRALGLEDIHRVEFPLGPQWTPTDWTLTATGSGQTLTFPSAYPSPPQYVWSSGRAENVDRPPPPSTLPGPVTLEAVWVGLGTEPDFTGRDVRGKAVVFHAMLAPGQMGTSSTWENVDRRAQAQGAAMTIGIWGYAGNMGVIQSTRAQQTPGFWMGFEDGQRLRDLIAEGPVTISASLDVDWVEGLTSPSLYGTLPGTTDEDIIITAHMDGWFDAALDNASGVAVMMALAEHFAQVPREQRRRNMIFVGTAGHHIGSPNSPYMRDQGMLENTALLLNAEHIAPAQFLPYGTELRRTAGVSPRRWWVHGSDELLDVALDAYRTFGVSIVGPMHPSASGEIGQIDEEAPSIQLIRSPEHKHTDLDVPELVPSAGLEAVARAFAKIIDGVNTMSLAELRRGPEVANAPSTAQEYPHAFPRPGVTKLLENDRVLVWEATWPSSVAQVYHRHQYDMTGVFLRWGPLRVTRLDGTYTESLEPFEVPRVFFQAQGVTHKEEGIGEPVRHAIMIDLKEHHPPPAPRRSGLRPAFPIDGAEEVIDNERVTVRSLELAAGETVPVHHHERDAVWVFVERPGTLRIHGEDGTSTTLDAEPRVVRFVPRGTVHGLEATSGSLRVMIYELK